MKPFYNSLAQFNNYGILFAVKYSCIWIAQQFNRNAHWLRIPTELHWNIGSRYVENQKFHPNQFIKTTSKKATIDYSQPNVILVFEYIICLFGSVFASGTCWHEQIRLLKRTQMNDKWKQRSQHVEYSTWW